MSGDSSTAAAPLTNGLGNFKGVMLCNRPTQIPGSLQAATLDMAGRSPGSVSRPAFLSRVSGEIPVGLPPARRSAIDNEENEEINTPQPAQPSVTKRHRKWLSAFQAARKEVERSKEAKADREKAQAEALAARLRHQRDLIRTIKAGEGAEVEKAQRIEEVLSGNSPSVEISHRPEPQRAQEVRPVPPVPVPAPAPAPPAAAVFSGKPGWARSVAEENAHFDAEADALLDFASSLSFENLVEDLEVREALRFVQQRVKNMEKQEKEKEEKEKQDKEREERQLRFADAEAQRASQANYGENPFKEDFAEATMISAETLKSSMAAANGNTIESARDVLAQNEKMKFIHSTQSVKALIEKTQEFSEEKNTQSLAITAPLVAVTHEKSALVAHQQMRSKQKEPDTLNLPYLYRHPGV